MENENLSKEDLDNEDVPENLASYVSVDADIQTKEPFISKFWSFLKNLFTLKFLFRKNKPIEEYENNLSENDYLTNEIKEYSQQTENESSKESEKENSSQENVAESANEDQTEKEELNNQDEKVSNNQDDEELSEDNSKGNEEQREL